MLAYPSLQGILQLDMYKSSDIPLYQSESLPSVINPEPNATSRLPHSADHPPDGISRTREFVEHTCTASIGCIRDTARRERRIATGIALGARNARAKKAEVPKNPRHGAELLYGVGSAYEPPKMSLLPKFAGHSC